MTQMIHATILASLISYSISQASNQEFVLGILEWSSAFMAPSHCTGPGTGMGPGKMSFYIMLRTVHTTEGQRTEPETNGF